jgi:hypothetical protein
VITVTEQGGTTSQRLRRPRYRDAVEWIALNDEPSNPDVAELLSVALIADIFGTTPERVAQDVIRFRAKYDV